MCATYVLLYARQYSFLPCSGGVPVWIDISNRIQVVMAASGQSSGSIVGPGFKYDNTISIGIAYTQANGWRTIQERGVSFTQRAPSIDLRGSATLTATVILDVKFSLFSAWNINLKLKPFVSATLTFGVSSCGGAVRLAMQVCSSSHGKDGSLILGCILLTSCFTGRHERRACHVSTRCNGEIVRLFRMELHDYHSRSL